MKLLSVKEVAEIMNLKPKTVYQWAESGVIPCVKLKGCLRFDMEDIKNWIIACKKEPCSGYNPLTQARSPRKGVDK